FSGGGERFGIEAEGRGRANGEAGADVGEGDADFVAFDFHGGVEGAGGDDVFFVDEFFGSECEASADGGLIFGVYVGRFADIDRDGHGGVGEFERGELGFAEAGPGGICWGIGGREVGGELNENEGEIALGKVGA